MLTDLNYRLSCLTVYRSLLQDPVMSALRSSLENLQPTGDQSLAASDAFHSMVHRLLQTGLSFGDHLLDLISHDDNPFSRNCELYGLDSCSAALQQVTARDLRILQDLYVNPSMVAVPEWQELQPLFDSQEPAGSNSLLTWLRQSEDWGQELSSLADHYRKHSRGMISRYRALSWEGEGLQGLEHPDLPRMSDLIGYESQKEQILANTRQFVEGFPANNILLYGSRGTGKSTMVKSLIHECWDWGLRLVEVGRIS